MAKIMIVEDEAIIADEIQMMLELMGHEVIANIQNGDKALDAFANLKPDLALLDITIKGSYNGIDLAHVIREKYQFPFVFLTSHSDKMTLEEVKKTLPYGYIVKPYTQQNLMTTIELALFKFSTENQTSYPSQEQFYTKLKVHFTDREYEILESLVSGKTYKEISQLHFISVNTVKTYLKSIFQKLDVSSRHEASVLVLNLMK